MHPKKSYEIFLLYYDAKSNIPDCLPTLPWTGFIPLSLPLSSLSNDVRDLVDPRLNLPFTGQTSALVFFFYFFHLSSFSMASFHICFSFCSLSSHEFYIFLCFFTIVFLYILISIFPTQLPNLMFYLFIQLPILASCS
jgi:hypothetical protein